MYIQVRLYVNQDFDLLTYNELSYIKLDDVIYSSVCAYVRGLKFQLPQISEVNVDKITNQRICVTFNEKKDADVVNWLNHVRNGQLNSVIKMITRLYMPHNTIDNIYILRDNITPNVANITPEADPITAGPTVYNGYSKTAGPLVYNNFNGTGGPLIYDDLSQHSSLNNNTHQSTSLSYDSAAPVQKAQDPKTTTNIQEPNNAVHSFPNESTVPSGMINNEQENLDSINNNLDMKQDNIEESAFDMFEGLGENMFV